MSVLVQEGAKWVDGLAGVSPPGCEVPTAQEELLQELLVQGEHLHSGGRAVDFPLCVVFHERLELQPLPIRSHPVELSTLPKHSCSSSLKREVTRKTWDFPLFGLFDCLFVLIFSPLVLSGFIPLFLHCFCIQLLSWFISVSKSAVKGVWHLLLFLCPLLFLPWTCLQVWDGDLV